MLVEHGYGRNGQKDLVPMTEQELRNLRYDFYTNEVVNTEKSWALMKERSDARS